MLKPNLIEFFFPSRLRAGLRVALAPLLLLLAGAGCSAKLESDGLAGTGMAPAAAKPPAAEPDNPAELPDAGIAATDPVTTSPAGNDGAAGAAAPDAGAGSLPAPDPSPPGTTLLDPTCGEPPYQALHLAARDIMTPAGKNNELANVVVTLKHCLGQPFKLAPGGGTILVTAGVETWIRFAAPGYLPWLEGEVTLPLRGAPIPIEATLVPTAIASTLVPAWTAGSAIIYVEVRRGRAIETEACRSPAGVTLRVKNHPEALVRYRAKGAIAGFELPLTATSEEGVAMITNLLPPAQATVELEAEKDGCTYLPAYGDANTAVLFPILRTPLEGGSITHQVFNPAR